MLVNYETTWYPQQSRGLDLVQDRRRSARSARWSCTTATAGPKEIGVQPEFLAWLTDPEQNGAGALFDFGCYGANLMTWLMDDQRPDRRDRRDPADQARRSTRSVDDEATIILEYPGRRGSSRRRGTGRSTGRTWRSTARRGYGDHGGRDALRVHLPGKDETSYRPRRCRRTRTIRSSYLWRWCAASSSPRGSSSLENNLIVTEILDAARRSAAEGRTISLAGDLPRQP